MELQHYLAIAGFFLFWGMVFLLFYLTRNWRKKERHAVADIAAPIVANLNLTGKGPVLKSPPQGLPEKSKFVYMGLFGFVSLVSLYSMIDPGWVVRMTAGHERLTEIMVAILIFGGLILLAWIFYPTDMSESQSPSESQSNNK